MTAVVISQPMLFPWIGLFEQIQASDIYVHYVDAHFSKGSFTNRVQVKTGSGTKWLTVPLKKAKLGTDIRETQVNYLQPWQQKHIEMLKQSYARAKFSEDMIALVEEVYGPHDDTICSLAIRSMNSICAYYGLSQGRKFLQSHELDVQGAGSPKVVGMVRKLAGTVYITGHGAQNYLDHDAFEQAGIEVRYMNYRKKQYPQLHGAFTPYVTILDLIANVGLAGKEYICSDTVNWREFLK
jgi:hypothetical protein